jgi:hypothetical protein
MRSVVFVNACCCSCGHELSTRPRVQHCIEFSTVCPLTLLLLLLQLLLLTLLLLLLLQEVKPIIWASEYSKYKAEQKKNGKQ